MPKITRLVSLLHKLEEQLVHCMRCGMCQAVCPVYAETKKESDTARGKLALLTGLSQQILQDEKGVERRLHHCLLCGACAASCPSGVDTMQIYFEARAILAGYKGLPLLEKLLFRGILSHPPLFDFLGMLAGNAQTMLFEHKEMLSAVPFPKLVTSLLRKTSRVSLSPAPFHRRIARRTFAPRQSGIKAALFPGCLVDKVFPDVGTATITTLDYHQVELSIVQGLVCCGIPALSAGDVVSFKKLVALNIKQLRTMDFDYLITPCATCLFAIKRLWPSVVVDDQRDIIAIAHKTLDISQFLVEKIGVVESSHCLDADPVNVTYHDPCHLKQSMNLVSQPRTILNASSGVAFKEMPEAGRCCGFGGRFNLAHKTTSESIGRKKRKYIEDSGCSVVATGCPGCMLQLENILKDNDGIQVKHTIEVYAESLKLLMRSNRSMWRFTTRKSEINASPIGRE